MTSNANKPSRCTFHSPFFTFFLLVELSLATHAMINISMSMNIISNVLLR
jgi:hypothetical protein